MNITYDEKIDVLYLEFSESAIHDSIEFGPGVNADLADDKTLVGLEVLNVSQKIDAGSFSHLEALRAKVKPFYTTRELARVLNVKETTISGKIRRGELQAIALGGRAGYRIPSSEVEALLARR